MDLFLEIERRMRKINEIKPFEGYYLEQIKQFYKNETTFSSSALDGNTFSLQEIKVTFEEGITIGGHSIRDFYEVEGLGKAFEFMFSLIKKRDITEDEIKKCHYIFSRNIPDFTGSGEYRKKEPLIKEVNREWPKADEIPQRMAKYIEWTKKERSSMHSVVFAAEVHRRFINISPFSEANGKIARFLMNTFLFQDKMFPVPVYLSQKQEYIEKLEKNDGRDFAKLIAMMELHSLKSLLRFLHLG